MDRVEETGNTESHRGRAELRGGKTTSLSYQCAQADFVAERSEANQARF